MPPKGQQQQVEQEEEELQAVILADSFNARFRPLTVDRPRCLLPLLNVPLLAWTLESLAAAGVKEVFVFCCAHAERIKDWLSTSQFSSNLSTIKIHPIISNSSLSTGDALRELDARQLIVSDFVLISGDVVSTVNIEDIVNEHRERRKKSKDAIMSIVCREVGGVHRLRPLPEAPVFVINPTTAQLHAYTTLSHPSVHRSTSEKRAAIPYEILESNEELEFRNDLVDCSIDICSVDVPLLFTENFDYQDLRHDFVNGILTSDLLGKTIHVHVVSENEGYAGRVRDGRSYAAISKDIIARWTFPMAPDENMPDGQRYEHRQNYQYIGKEGIVLAQSSTVSSHSLIGSHATLAEHTRIERSVLGQRVTVGASTTVRESYVWEGARIGADCLLEESIVGHGAVLQDGVVLERGCLVGEGVTLGKGVHLPAFSRVGRTRWNEEEEDEETEEEKAERLRVLGPDSIGYLWPADMVTDAGEEESDDEEGEDPLSVAFSRLGHRAPSPTPSGTSTLSTISRASSPALSVHSSAASVQGIPTLSLDPSSSADFHSECVQSLERAFDEGHSIDNAAIELKTLRMASNVPLREVRKVVINFVVGRVPAAVPGKRPAEVMDDVESVMGKWAQLIEQMTGEDQVEALALLQDFCVSHPSHTPLFPALLRSFYDHDVATEEAIYEWYKTPEARGEAGSMHRDLWEKSRRFIEALLEASDSEEESEDESD